MPVSFLRGCFTDSVQVKFYTCIRSSDGPLWQSRRSTARFTLVYTSICRQGCMGRIDERASDGLSNRSTCMCRFLITRAHQRAFINMLMCFFRLVEKYGEGSWSRLVPYFQGRIGKQLRERWNHELRPDIMKGAWTQEEEAMLVVQHRIHKNAWADIAKVSVARQGSCRRSFHDA